MRIRLEDPIICDLLLEGQSYAIEPSVAELLGVLGAPGAAPDMKRRICAKLNVEEAIAAPLLQDLIKAGIVVKTDAWADQMAAIRHWEQRGWLDALILHLRSRDLPYDDVDDGHDRQTALRSIVKSYESDGAQPEIWTARSGIAAAIELGPPQAFPAGQTLEQVLLRRRSGGKWRGGDMSLQLLSSILHYPNIEGKASRCEMQQYGAQRSELLFYNSSYAALETHVLIFRSQSLAMGLYFYDMERHSLVPLKLGDFRECYGRMCIGQHWFANGNAALIISAIWDKYMFRYRHPRAYRNLFINTAQLAHKYILAATAHGLTNYITPAFNDDVAAELLDTEPLIESPLYTVAIG